ncbi:MAG: fumarylacetoacetate hydrolase family protein, partial [Burkholderiales bacterium]|nr:fumarylacetoacetate hydrolase family protein [Burkholderiales bacterium]
MLDETHAPSARAWLANANQGGDFPLQNLPYGACRRKGSAGPFWVGVAIGDSALNLGALSHRPVWTSLGPGLDSDLAQQAARAAEAESLNALMAQGPDAWQALRLALFRLLRADAAPALQLEVQACLAPLATIEHQAAVRVGEYTDFYTSLHHARNVGQAIGNGGLVPPNFFWMPVAYHGRASSLGVNQQVRRPVGQVMAPGAASPVVGPSQRLDYELELAVYVGQGNAQGTPVPVAEA